MKSVFLSTYLAIALFVLLGAAPARAEGEFKMPDCATLEKWSSILPLHKSVAELHDPAFVERKKQAMKIMLSDEEIISVFGIPNGKWPDQRIRAVETAIFHCSNALRKNKKYDEAQRMTNGGYIVGRPSFINREQRIKNY